MFASWFTVASHFLLILELINFLDDYQVREFISLIKRYNYFLPHHFRARLKTMTFNTLRSNYIREIYLKARMFQEQMLVTPHLSRSVLVQAIKRLEVFGAKYTRVNLN
jgi:hypothetical protein